MTSGKDELAEVEDKIKRTKLSKEAREKARQELKKLRQMSPMSAEATVVRNYLDWLLSIPWNKKTKVKKDLALAQEILDNDHYGLEKVKERIVEQLAVQQRANNLTGPILCLVGPPGVGKTSLGRIDRAGDRARLRARFARRCARRGGDSRAPADLYRLDAGQGDPVDAQGAVVGPAVPFGRGGQDGRRLPRRPVFGLAGSARPRAEPHLNDHYLEVDYDLSHVMFITTANTLNIPPFLMDCMEIIRIAGYTEDEKVEIARKHLIPHAITKHGLKDGEWAISDEALLLLIRRYTREPGVRNLERELSSLIRKAVKELTLHNKQSITVEANTVADYLGVPKPRSLGILDDGDLRSRAADRRSRRSVRYAII